jgi:hypothetical protein
MLPLLVLSVLPGVSLAAPLQIRPELATSAPIDVGVGVLVEGGPRLRAATRLGLLPDPYLDGINAAIGLFEPSWTAEEEALVETALDGSLVWRTEAGWRFVPRLGLYTHAVYTFAGLGGQATTEEILEALTGEQVPDDTRFGQAGGREFEAAAALHLLGAEIGWDQRVWRRLHVRAAVGWNFTVASNTTIGPAFEPAPVAAPAYAAVGEAGADYLDSIFQGYAHPPTVTLAVGWSLGR